MGKFPKYFDESISVLPAEPAGGCGGCVACCTIMGVKSLDKHQFIPCVHQLYRIGDSRPDLPGGCGINDSKPEECAGYKCLWRAGCMLPLPQNRPDRLGIIADLPSPELVEAVGRPFIQVHECWPGARREPRVRYVLEALAERMPYVFVYYNKSGCYIMGPEDFKRAVVRAWVGEDNYRLMEIGVLPA